MKMENSSPMTGSREASASSSGNQIQAPPPKKKRNLPGMPGDVFFFRAEELKFSIFLTR